MAAAVGATSAVNYSVSLSTSKLAGGTSPRCSSSLKFHAKSELGKSLSFCLNKLSSKCAFQSDSALFFRSGEAEGRIRSLIVRAATSVAAPPKFKTLKPLGDRVLVKRQIVEEKTSGGILLPTTAQSKPQGGEVVAVGDGKTVGDKKLEPALKVGDLIVYSKYAGTEVQFNDSDHLLLKEDDIVGLLATDDIKDLQPLNDRVLIKVAEAEEKTAGGVLLTDSAKEKPVIGEVLAVGPGGIGEDGNRKPLDIAAGNTVLYSKYAGNDFKSKDGTQYVVMRAPDVLAVLS